MSIFGGTTEIMKKSSAAAWAYSSEQGLHVSGAPGS